MITVWFGCGHKARLNADDALGCPVCGHGSVRRVDAPPPRIRGTATGPHVESCPLEPVAVTIGTGVGHAR